MTPARGVTTIHESLGQRSRSIVVTPLAGVTEYSSDAPCGRHGGGVGALVAARRASCRVGPSIPHGRPQGPHTQSPRLRPRIHATPAPTRGGISAPQKPTPERRASWPLHTKSRVITMPSRAAIVFSNTRLAIRSALDGSLILGLKWVRRRACAPAACAMVADSSASM